ncbi:MAG: hypothetical protein ACRELY_20945, partial [Polyangiaceae bacterium]
MTRRTRILNLLLLFGVLVACGVALVVHIENLNHPVVPPSLVPPEWQAFRTSAGHHTHVDEQNIPCKACHDYEREGFKDPGTEPCKGCHEKEKSQTHAGDAALVTTCTTCHSFAPREAPTCI